MNRDRVIGIPAGSLGDNSFGANKTHLDFISEFGKPRIIMPWEEIADIDVLYLPGGSDIAPTTYNEIPGFYTGYSDPHKEFFFQKRLDNYIDRIPIIGVCLGMQQLGVKFGSKLTQNFRFHEQSASRWTNKGHKVNITRNRTRVKVLPITMEVNSHHHQGVTKSNLSPDLYSLYEAKNNDILFNDIADPIVDPIIECFIHRSLPILACQWHFEEMYDNTSLNLVKYIIEDYKPIGED